MTAAPHSPVGPGGARTSLWLLTSLAVLWTAYFVQPIAVPFVFAVLLKFLLSPAVRAFRRRGVPIAITSLLLVVGGVVGCVAVVAVVAPAAAHWTQELPERLHRLEGKALALSQPVAAITDVTTRVGEKVDDLAAAASADSKPSEAPTVVRIEQPTWFATAFGALQRLAIELFLTVGMLFLLLLGDGMVLAKLQAGGAANAPRWLDALSAIERRMGLYVRSLLLVQTCLGITFGLFCWAWGMPSPWLWGAVAAIGNAIPFVGPLAVTALLSLVAVTTFPATGIAVVVPLAYVALHLVESTLATPCLLGRWLSLSPVAIFVTLTVMGFVWGVAGLVLAVPLLVVVRITSDYVPAMQPLQILLDGRVASIAGAEAIRLPARTSPPVLPTLPSGVRT